MEDKKSYETVIIIKGSYIEKEYQEALDKVKGYMKDLIKIEKVEEMGLRKLAYEVKRQNVGYYVVIEFKAVSENIRELERIYRINDDILKFIVVSKED